MKRSASGQTLRAMSSPYGSFSRQSTKHTIGSYGPIHDLDGSPRFKH